MHPRQTTRSSSTIPLFSTTPPPRPAAFTRLVTHARIALPVAILLTTALALQGCSDDDALDQSSISASHDPTQDSRGDNQNTSTPPHDPQDISAYRLPTFPTTPTSPTASPSTAPSAAAPAAAAPSPDRSASASPATGDAANAAVANVLQAIAQSSQSSQPPATQTQTSQPATTQTTTPQTTTPPQTQHATQPVQRTQPAPAAASTSPTTAAATTTAIAATPANSIVFVEHKLHDPGMNNMHSHTLLVPQGWEVQGGLQRMPPILYNMPVVMDLQVISPDGRRARFLPSFSFEYGSNSQAKPWQPLQSGNIYMPPPQSIGQWIVQQTTLQPEKGVTNVKLVSEEPVPDITQQLRQQYAMLYESTQQTNQMAATTGMQVWFDTQAVNVKITYDKDSQPFEESILVCWLANTTAYQGQIFAGMWSITGMFSVRNKPGQDALNDPVIRTIFQSIRTTPQWQKEMNNYFLELARIRNKGARDRQEQFAKSNRIIQENNREINEMITKGWRDRQASNERIQSKTVDSIYEVTPYKTPEGNVVKLPSHYGHVHTDGQGRYILHNDANYNPNLDPNLNNRNWQTVEQAK